MLTTGQAEFFRQNVNSVVALLFVASFAFMVGLTIWHAAFGQNPVADLLAEVSATNSAVSR